MSCPDLLHFSCSSSSLTSALFHRNEEKDNKTDTSCPQKRKCVQYYTIPEMIFLFRPFCHERDILLSLPFLTHFVCIGVVNLKGLFFCCGVGGDGEGGTNRTMGSLARQQHCELLGGPPAEIRGSTEDDFHCTRAVPCTVLSHELLLPTLFLWFRLSREPCFPWKVLNLLGTVF